MRLPRRTVLRLAAGAAALPLALRAARAQRYPAGPVRIIVGFVPGGATDLIARVIAQFLSERLGQPFVVENRPGASTNIATEAVVRAPADGATLLLATADNAINATVYADLPFNFLRDTAPVASVVSVPNVMEVNPANPDQTLSAFIADAKAHPGKINFASVGSGSPSHVTGELLKMMTGIDMVHVPYRGGAQVVTDLMGGRVDVFFGALSGSIDHIRSGRLRALAVTSAERSPALPDVPTVGEFVAGYAVSAFFGLVAPKNTPAAIVATLNDAVNAGLADAKVRSRLENLGGAALPMTPAAFGKLMADDTEKWATVVKFAGIKPE